MTKQEEEIMNDYVQEKRAALDSVAQYGNGFAIELVKYGVGEDMITTLKSKKKEKPSKIQKIKRFFAKLFFTLSNGYQ